MARSDDPDKTAVLSPEQTLAKEAQSANDQPDCLVLILGNDKGQLFAIPDGEAIVGRDPEAGIYINDSSVSRKHARITRTEEGVVVEDLGSSNGTEVNRTRLQSGQKHPLQHEDHVKFGNSVLKFLKAGSAEIMSWKEMNSKANVDPLTQISNKRFLSNALDAEFKRARSLGQPLSVLFFDIDHFKKCNDTYGHDAGDYVLKEFTKEIRTRFVQGKDVFARYGGEEFVIILFGRPASEGLAIAEQIRAAIETKTFLYEGKTIPVTSSIGIAELTDNITSPEDLLKKADGALYQAKEGGRNRSVIAS